jgi:hypothetical protein
MRALRLVFVFTLYQLNLTLTSQCGGPLSILRNFVWVLGCTQCEVPCYFLLVIVPTHTRDGKLV